MPEKCISRLEHVEGQRYRESHGMFYDDFDVGDIYEHRPGRTITEVDNIWQSLINLNQHPLHIDNEYAKRSEFGKPVVSSLVTLSIIGGLSLSSTSARGIANLGWEDITCTVPVYVGDTVYAETTVVAKRRSRSRPGQGIVTVQTKGLKSEGTVFMSMTRSFLVPVRDSQGTSE